MSAEKVELTERLELIESMIVEGRRSTTRWAMDDCAVGRGVLRGDRVVFRDVWRADLGPALHGVAGDDDRHVAAELGSVGADAHKRKGADDHGGAGDYLHLGGDGNFDVCAAAAAGAERQG